MGVPSFFRWLVDKYPAVIQAVIEEQEGDPRARRNNNTNPNGFEIDCLYIDMNGIIHPCSHPEKGPQPQSLSEIYKNVELYVERLFNMAKPRRLLYMAIDGVAPRAKMNQQRSRRFRSAQEADQKRIALEEERRDLISRGLMTEEEAQQQRDRHFNFDSNCITPGTEFMYKLANFMREFVIRKQQTDPAWKKIAVILSDANVPGEGEHKIMEFIRYQRTQPGYNPNTQHCVCGLDADLIMLALATHEPRFCILREKVTYDRNKKGKGSNRPLDSEDINEKPHEFLHVNVLREYLEHDLRIPDKELGFKWSLERAIDDFVFLCFFVGNDFLPHVPTLKIHEGAIDLLVQLYKTHLSSMGGYITENGDVSMPRVQKIMEEIGKAENTILELRVRKEQQQQQRKRDKAKKWKERKASLQAHKSIDKGYTHEKISAKRKETGKIVAKTLKIGDTYTIHSVKHSSGSDGGENVSVAFKAIYKRKPKLLQVLLRETLEGGATSNTRLSYNYEHVTKLYFVVCPDKTILELTSSKEPVYEISQSGQKMTETLIPPFIDEIESKDDVKTIKMEFSTFFNLSRIKQVAESDEHIASIMSVENVEGASLLALVVPPKKEEPEASADKKDEKGGDASDGKDKPLVVKVPAPEAKDAPIVVTLGGEDVRLGEEGWRERYYKAKFKVSIHENNEFREKIRLHYAEGLKWVMEYYYQGCASWRWFYPYYYAPFSAETYDVGELKIEYDKGTPFKPIEQLMGVLPPGSCTLLPAQYRPLMLEDSSPLIKYYPKKFDVDPNGEKVDWKYVILVPFIEENDLLGVMTPMEATLKENEKKRNTLGDPVIFVGSRHELFKYKAKLTESEDGAVELDPTSNVSIYGKVSKVSDTIDELCRDSVACFKYDLPERGDTVFQSKLLKGAKMPKSRVNKPRYLANRKFYLSHAANRMILHGLECMDSKEELERLEFEQAKFYGNRNNRGYHGGDRSHRGGRGGRGRGRGRGGYHNNGGRNYSNYPNNRRNDNRSNPWHNGDQRRYNAKDSEGRDSRDGQNQRFAGQGQRLGGNPEKRRVWSRKSDGGEKAPSESANQNLNWQQKMLLQNFDSPTQSNRGKRGGRRGRGGRGGGPSNSRPPVFYQPKNRDKGAKDTREQKQGGRGGKTKASFTWQQRDRFSSKKGNTSPTKEPKEENPAEKPADKPEKQSKKPVNDDPSE